MTLKRFLILLSLSTLLIFLLTACPQAVGDTQPPSVTIKSIADVITSTLPVDVTAGATVTDNRGVRKVEFSLYKDTTLVEGPISKTQATNGSYYSHTFSINQYGDYTVKIKAYDLSNLTTEKTEAFSVRAPAGAASPTISNVIWDSKVGSYNTLKDSRAKFRIYYSDPDGDISKVHVSYYDGTTLLATKTILVSGWGTSGSKYLDEILNWVAANSYGYIGTVKIQLEDSKGLKSNVFSVDDVYALSASAPEIEITPSATEFYPGLNFYKVGVQNWNTGTIAGTIKVELARFQGDPDPIEATGTVTGFASTTAEVPIPLVNTNTYDNVIFRVYYKESGGEYGAPSFDQYARVNTDTEDPKVTVTIPQAPIEGEPIVFNIHAEDNAMLEAITEMRLYVYRDVEGGDNEPLEIGKLIPLALQQDYDNVFARYRIKINGHAYNDLADVVNDKPRFLETDIYDPDAEKNARNPDNTTWVEIFEDGNGNQIIRYGDYYYERGERVPYVIYEIDRSWEQGIKIDEIAKYFDATVTMYVDFVRVVPPEDWTGSIEDYIRQAPEVDVKPLDIIDAYIEAGEKEGQGAEYDVGLTIKDWRDVEGRKVGGPNGGPDDGDVHFHVNVDDVTPQITLEKIDHYTQQRVDITNQATADLWPNDQLYIKISDSKGSLHFLNVNITSEKNYFVDPSLASLDQDYVFSVATTICFTDDSAWVGVQGKEPDWTKTWTEFTFTYEAPDTPLATFTLDATVSDRSYAKTVVYDPGVTLNAMNKSEEDAENALIKPIRITTRQDGIYTLLVKETNLVSYPSDKFYRTGRYLLENDPYFDDIWNEYEEYPLMRDYSLNWPEYEIGNEATPPKLPIVGGPDKDAEFKLLTKDDIQEVKVYLVKGYYPDTGSLVEAGIDLNDPDHNPPGIDIYGPKTLTSETLPHDYDWHLNDLLPAEEATSATYTFVVLAYDRTAEDESMVVETAEFPFILDVKGPKIMLYNTPFAVLGGPTNWGPWTEYVEPDLNQEVLFTATMTMEIVDDFAGFNITTSDPESELRGQIKFYSPTIVNPDRKYPYNNSPRSFLDIFNSGSFVSPVVIDGHVKSEFVGMNVANGNMWDQVNSSNIRQVSIWTCDELGNPGTWTTLAQVRPTSEFADPLIIDGAPGDEWQFGDPPFDFTIDVGDSGEGSIWILSNPITAHFTAQVGPDATVTFDGTNVTIETATGTVSGPYSGNIHTLVVKMGEQFDYRTIVIGAADNRPPVINVLFNGQDISNNSITTFDDPANYQIAVSDDSNFTATVTTDGATYILNKNSPTIALSASGYGDHRIEVVAQDEGGYSSSAVATITIDDNQAPVITFNPAPDVTVGNEGTLTSDNTVVLAVTISDDHKFDAIVKYGSTTYTFTDVNTGQIQQNLILSNSATVTVRATDVANNPTSAILHVVVDSVAPTTTIDLGGPATGVNTTVVGTYTATDTNFAGAKIDWSLTPAYYGSVVNGSFDPATPGINNPITIDVGNSDLSTLLATVTAWDSAGNISTDSSCASVDNLFWSVNIYNVSPNVVTGNTNVSLIFDVKDAEIADASITADSTIVTSISTNVTDYTYNPVICGTQFYNYIREKFGSAGVTFTLPASTETVVTLTLTATDLAGNTDSTSVDIIVDNKAPTLVGTNVNVNQDYVDLQFHEDIDITSLNATVTIGSVNYPLKNKQLLTDGKTVRLTFDDGTGSTLDLSTPCTVTFDGVYDVYGNGPTSGTVSF